MSESWLDRACPSWFKFGHRVGRPEQIDVSDVDGDVFEGVPEEIADKLIAERDRHVNAVREIMKFRYGTR